jgi:hypothetical protein
MMTSDDGFVTNIVGSPGNTYGSYMPNYFIFVDSFNRILLLDFKTSFFKFDFRCIFINLFEKSLTMYILYFNAC